MTTETTDQVKNTPATIDIEGLRTAAGDAGYAAIRDSENNYRLVHDGGDGTLKALSKPLPRKELGAFISGCIAMFNFVGEEGTDA